MEDFNQRLLQLKVQALRSKVTDLETADSSATRNWTNPQQHPQPQSQFSFPPIQQTFQQQQSFVQPYAAPMQPMQPMFLPTSNSQHRQQQMQRARDRRRKVRERQQEEEQRRLMFQMQMAVAAKSNGRRTNSGGTSMGREQEPAREDALLSRLDRVLDQNSKLIEEIAGGGGGGSEGHRSIKHRRTRDRPRKINQRDYDDDEEKEGENYSEAGGRVQRKPSDGRRRQVSWSNNGTRTRSSENDDGGSSSSSSSSSRSRSMNGSDGIDRAPQPQQEQQQLQSTKQNQQQTIETIDGTIIDEKTNFQEFEGGSPALQDAKKWFVERVTTTSSLGVSMSNTENLLDLESDDEEEDDDIESFQINENKQDDDVENEKKRREMRLKIKKQLGILDLKKPRWRYKKDEEMPTDKADFMIGMQAFRSVVKCIQFPLKLSRLVRQSVQESVHKDQADVAEFMNLYFDLSKNWLSSLVKTPVLSVVKNHRLNLDLTTKGSAQATMDALKRMFGAKSKREITREKLMQCKVRVKGLVDILMSASRKTPQKLCEFFAKYFVMDGVAFPGKYLWTDEERQLEFNTLGMTRRMVYKDSDIIDVTAENERNGGSSKQETSYTEDKAGLLITERPRMLIVNFLIARVLIGQVLLKTEQCQGLGGGGGGSGDAGGSSSGGSSGGGGGGSAFNYKTKRNLQYLGSLFYLILCKLHEELPESYGEPIQKKKKQEEEEDDEDDEDDDEEGEEDGKDEDDKDGNEGESKDGKDGKIKKKGKKVEEQKGKKKGKGKDKKKEKEKEKEKEKKKKKPPAKKKKKKPKDGKSGAKLQRKNPDIFVVTFEEGPLGLDLEPWHGDKGAAIVGIKENTQSAKKRKLYEGQHIVKIGRRVVDHLAFPVVLGMLQKLKRPLKITFREHPSAAKWVDEHMVRFPDGPLGLDLAKGAGQVGTVVTLSKSGEVRPGEYIVKIGPNGPKQVNVGDKDLEETIKVIKSMKRPLEIRFVKIRNKPKSEKERRRSIAGAEEKKNEKNSNKDGSDDKDGNEKDGNERGSAAKGGPSKFKWVSIEDLTGELFPIEVFNKACENKKQIDELDDWLDTMADRLDQWATAVISEVMKAAAAMQKRE